MGRGPTAAVLLTCLVLQTTTTIATAATTAATDIYEEPALAEVLADPAADGYDRTFSMCQVEAKEFQATVRSTAYRVLKGVCNPGELERYLDSMEERFNEKLDNFIVQITNLLRQNIGTDIIHESSASVGDTRNDILLGGAAKETTWKAEKAKQHAFGGDKTKRSHSKHLKHDSAHNDNWSNSVLSNAEERRRAVQNLLPGGRHGSAGSTLFKTLPGAVSAPRDWPGPVTNSTQESVTTWTPHHPRRHSRHQDDNQFAAKKGGHWASDSASDDDEDEQNTTAPTRHLGRGQHVTDTISYISPRQSALKLRYSELPAYNDTVYYMNGQKMFSYYWSIGNIGTMMSSCGPEESVRSSSFYVYHGGYRMFLRLFPRWQGDSVLIRVGLSAGRHDRSLRWPFRLPLRLSVLDHSFQPDDLQSRLWRPQREPCPRRTWHRPAQRRRQARRTGGHEGHACLGLSVPHALLQRRRAVLEDALLVKLDVFLEEAGGGRGRRR